MVSKANSLQSFFMALVLAAVASSAFWPALHGPFVFDDYHLPFFEAAASRMPVAFWIGGVRPLLMATFWLNFSVSGTDPGPYHAVNIALHCVAAALFFLILRRLTTFSGSKDTLSWLSVAGTAIFLLHPLQTESVDYVAGRSEVLCGAFVLAGWLIFLDHMEKPLGIFPAAAILVCGLAAILSKESGVCLPLLLIASDLCWGNGPLQDRLRKRKLLYAPMLIGSLAAVALVLRMLNRSSTAGLSGSIPPGLYALTETRAILIYLRLFVVPVGQNVDWQLPFARSLADAWPDVVGMLILIAAGSLLWRRVRLASFGLLVFLLTLAPTSSFVPVADAMAERRMYLPIAGLAICVVGIADAVQLPLQWKATCAAAAILALAVLTAGRSAVWASDLLLWQSSIAHSPGNARAHAGLGGAYMLRQDCLSAAREYRKVVDLEGMNEISGRNLATAYECSQQNDLALETYQALVAVHPDAASWNRIGYLEALKDHVAASLAAFENALRLDPNNSVAYSYRGTGRLALGDTAGAGSDFRRALALDPNNAVAAKGLAQMAAR